MTAITSALGRLAALTMADIAASNKARLSRTMMRSRCALEILLVGGGIERGAS